MKIYDPAGDEIVEGSLLLNEQGKVFMAMKTDATIIAEKHVRARLVNKSLKETYLMVNHVFIINDGLLHKAIDQKTLQEVWQKYYEEYVRPASRQAIADRRKDFQENKRRQE